MPDDNDSDDGVYDTGPFCRHWRDPSDCDEPCARCGHPCRRHGCGECNDCDACPEFIDSET